MDDEGEAIARFWRAARVHAGLDKIGVVAGESVAGVITPQAWSFGDTPELADELVALVLAGTKTATSTGRWEYGDEPLPRVGELSIVLDGAGNPRALIRTTGVREWSFRDVDAAFAAAEGEGDLSLEHWRTEHEAYFRRALAGTGREFTEDLELVGEEFELLYPRAS